MNLEIAIRLLKKSLKTKQPKTFSSTWIYTEVPMVYRYIWKHVRTENDDIDWDRVTCKLPRKFQKRWVKYRRKLAKEYQSQDEVSCILSKYRNRIHTLMVPSNRREERDQERIIVSLVRISQKGNVLAQRELISWLRFIVDEWVDRRWQIRKWKGYTDDLEDKIRGCIRCYKYTGTFIGYLFKTLEYSSRGIAPLIKYSLDDPVFDGSETMINFVVHDQQDI